MTTPVIFELAKLLKERGFDLKPNRHLVRKTSKIGLGKEFIIDRHLDYDDLYLEYVEKYIPTIAEVVMWLYEKHGIWITSTHVRNRFRYEIIKKDNMIDYSSFDFNSPTEAYEAAIEHSLKNLI
jgi:hypothetical protein